MQSLAVERGVLSGPQGHSAIESGDSARLAPVERGMGLLQRCHVRRFSLGGCEGQGTPPVRSTDGAFGVRLLSGEEPRLIPFSLGDVPSWLV